MLVIVGLFLIVGGLQAQGETSPDCDEELQIFRAADATLNNANLSYRLSQDDVWSWETVLAHPRIGDEVDQFTVERVLPQTCNIFEGEVEEGCEFVFEYLADRYRENRERAQERLGEAQSSLELWRGRVAAAQFEESIASLRLAACQTGVEFSPEEAIVAGFELRDAAFQDEVARAINEHVRVGLIAYNNSDTGTALTRLEQAASMAAPVSPGAAAIVRYYKGNIYAGLGEWSSAIAEYNRAITLVDPPSALYYYVRGNAHTYLPDAQTGYEAAINDYLAALALEPRNPLYYFALGSAYTHLGRWAEALEALRQYVRLGENDDPRFLDYLDALVALVGYDIDDELTQTWVTGLRQDFHGIAVSIPESWDAREVAFTDGSGFLSPRHYEFYMSNSEFPALWVPPANPNVELQLVTGEVRVFVAAYPTQTLNPNVSADAAPIDVIAIANDDPEALLEGPVAVDLGGKRAAYLVQRVPGTSFTRIFIALELGEGMTAFMITYTNLDEWEQFFDLSLTIAATMNYAIDPQPISLNTNDEGSPPDVGNPESPQNEVFPDPVDYTVRIEDIPPFLIPPDAPIISQENADNIRPVTFYGGTTPLTWLEDSDIKGHPAAWSPDGNWIAYISPQGLVIVQPGALDRQLVLPVEGQLSSIAFDPTSSRVTAVTSSGTMLTWDVLTGGLLWEVNAEGSLASIAYTPDGQMLVGTGSDNQVYLWNAADGQQIRSLTTADQPDGFEGVAVSADSRLIAAVQRVDSTTGDQLVVWDAATGEVVNMLTGFEPSSSNISQIISISFNPVDNRIAFTANLEFFDGGSSDSYAVGVWDPRESTTAQRLLSANLSGSELTFERSHVNWAGRNGETLVVAEIEHVTLIDVNESQPIARWEVPQPNIYNYRSRIIAVSPDGATLFGIATDRLSDYPALALYDTLTGVVLSSAVTEVGEQFHVELSPDGSLFAFADNGGVRVTNFVTGESRRYSWSVGGVPWDFDFDTGNSRLVIATRGSDMVGAVVIDLDSGETISAIIESGDNVEISPDGTRVLLADGGRSAGWYDADTGALLESVDNANGETVILSPDGSIIASGGSIGGMRLRGLTLFDVATGEMLAQIESENDKNFQFSADGRLIIMSNGTQYSAVTGQRVREGVVEYGDSAALSPDGSLVVVASDGVRIFSTETRVDLTGLLAEDAQQVAFSRDGRLLVVMQEASLIVLGIPQTLDLAASALEPTPDVAFWRLGGDDSLFISSLDGTNLRSIPYTSTTLLDIRWSPDGTRLAVGDTVIDLEGRNLLNIPYEIRPRGSLDWSPDSQQVVFEESVNDGIIVTPVEGFDPTRITPNERGDQYLSPDWSPVNDQIVFHATGSNERIAVVNSSGSGLRFLTDGTSFWALAPQWSPDGSQIAFVHRDAYSHSGGHIAVMNADGSNIRVIAETAGSIFKWSPDGQFIGTLLMVPGPNANSALRTALFVIDVANETLQQVPDGSNLLGWTADNRIAYRMDEATILFDPVSGTEERFPVDRAFGSSFYVPPSEAGGAGTDIQPTLTAMPTLTPTQTPTEVAATPTSIPEVLYPFDPGVPPLIDPNVTCSSRDLLTLFNTAFDAYNAEDWQTAVDNYSCVVADGREPQGYTNFQSGARYNLFSAFANCSFEYAHTERNEQAIQCGARAYFNIDASEPIRRDFRLYLVAALQYSDDASRGIDWETYARNGHILLHIAEEEGGVINDPLTYERLCVAYDELGLTEAARYFCTEAIAIAGWETYAEPWFYDGSAQAFLDRVNRYLDVSGSVPTPTAQPPSSGGTGAGGVPIFIAQLCPIISDDSAIGSQMIIINPDGSQTLSTISGAIISQEHHFLAVYDDRDPVNLTALSGVDYRQDFTPVISRDGQRVAFTSGGRLSVMGIDGSSRQSFDFGVDHFEWMPNSQDIVFANVGDSRIGVVNVETGEIVAEQTGLNFPEDGDFLSVEQDGSIVVVSGGNLNLYSAELTDETQLTTLSEAVASTVAFSPDGQTIAFVARTFNSSAFADVFLIQRDGSNLRNLTNAAVSLGTIYADLRWSSDGDSLLIDDAFGTYLSDAVTGSVSDLSETAGDAYWLPDGSGMLATVYRTSVQTEDGFFRQNVVDVYTLNANGSNPQILLQGICGELSVNPLYQGMPSVSEVRDVSVQPGATASPVPDTTLSPSVTPVPTLTSSVTLVPVATWTPSVTPTPSLTPPPTNTPPPTETPTASATPVTCPGTLTSRLIVGQTARVIVEGGNTANRIRSQATASAGQVGSIPPGDEFAVIDGPICADGYAWWMVDYDGLIGWTAEGDAARYWLEPLGGAPVIVPTAPPMGVLYVGGQATVFTADEGLKLRDATNTNSNILENMPSGIVVTLLEGPVSANGYVWWRVLSPSGREGWSVESADGIETLIPVDVTGAATGGTAVCSAITTPGDTNLRRGPGTSFEIAGVVGGGLEYTVIGQAINQSGFTWYQFENNLWARQDVVELQGDCTSIPMVR